MVGGVFGRVVPIIAGYYLPYSQMKRGITQTGLGLRSQTDVRRKHPSNSRGERMHRSMLWRQFTCGAAKEASVLVVLAGERVGTYSVRHIT